MTNAELIQKMESVLEGECRQYDKMADISQEQIRLLDEEHADIDRIVMLMEQKSILVEEIKRLEEENAPVKESWTKLHSNYSQEDKQNIASLKQRYIETLEHLSKQEDRIAHGIKDKQEEINQRLQAIRKGKEVNRAYLKYESGPPKFFDKKK